MRMIGAACLSCCLVLWTAGLLKSDDGDEIDSELARVGLRAESDSLIDFLDGLHPTAEQEQLVSELIAMLGSSDYHTREEATRRLIGMPTTGQAMLAEAAEGSEPEVAFRAKLILEARSSGQLENQLRLVMRAIVRHEIKGVTPTLLRTLPLVTKPYLRELAVQALIISARESDRELLQSAVEDEDENIRIAALRTLGAVYGESESDRIDGAFNDASPRVRLEAAIVAARQRRTVCLPVLVDVLSADDDSLRMRASSVLRSLTGENFGYSTYGEQAARDQAIEDWSEWVAARGADFELRDLSHRIIWGRTLVTLYSEHKALELDENGNEIWSVELRSAFACQGLPNGNRLIAQYSGNRVVEYDQKGELVWELTGLPGNISGISRNADGNTLLACGQDGNKLHEYNREGELVWSKIVNGTPVHAVRLENGLTLVSLMGDQKVVEIDHEGDRLWELAVDGKPYHAQRLPDGNTLVRFSSGDAAEYSRDGTKVAEFDSAEGYCVQRLDDGNTLIADSQGFRVYDPTGQVVQENNNYTGYLYVHRY